MKLNEIFEAASIILAKKAEENPGGGLKKGDTKITYDFLAKELKNTSLWCYKGTVDVVKVTRCKNCVNYKLYRKKDDVKSKGSMRCSLDKQRKSPDHYCGYAEEK